MSLILSHIPISELMFSSASEAKMTQIEMIKSKGNIFASTERNTFDVIETKLKKIKVIWHFPSKPGADTFLWHVSDVLMLRIQESLCPHSKTSLSPPPAPSICIISLLSKQELTNSCLTKSVMLCKIFRNLRNFYERPKKGNKNWVFHLIHSESKNCLNKVREQDNAVQKYQKPFSPGLPCPGQSRWN